MNYGVVIGFCFFFLLSCLFIFQFINIILQRHSFSKLKKMIILIFSIQLIHLLLKRCPCPHVGHMNILVFLPITQIAQCLYLPVSEQPFKYRCHIFHILRVLVNHLHYGKTLILAKLKTPVV